ncbi:ABC transporter permease [Cypionkella sp.]|uniref:ABC transporter permease n=1 Tax=Cypionkella sp. TaxID=2811411 RepID=UPI002618687D|nr:ABC transporter permease [Cypionkella sp.]MDB5665705.1 ddpC 1 [Cypionkella sp.]
MRALLADVWASPTGRIGMVLTAAILLFITFGPLVTPNPNLLAVQAKFLPPSLAHPMGTDNLGRDLLARAAQGTRAAVLIAVAVVALSSVIGALLGVIAGLLGGWIDRAILIIFDIVSAYPPVILAMGIVALYGTGASNLLLVVTILFLPQFGRMARAQTLSLRNQPFVDAERILGLGTARLVTRHLLPNVVGPLIVLASMNVPVVITIEAGLSFLGLGVQPPQASLGTLIKDGYIYLDQSWWPTIGAAAILAITTLGATLFGEALRDASDPKRKGRFQ